MTVDVFDRRLTCGSPLYKIEVSKWPLSHSRRLERFVPCTGFLYFRGTLQLSKQQEYILWVSVALFDCRWLLVTLDGSERRFTCGSPLYKIEVSKLPLSQSRRLENFVLIFWGMCGSLKSYEIWRFGKDWNRGIKSWLNFLKIYHRIQKPWRLCSGMETEAFSVLFILVN